MLSKNEHPSHLRWTKRNRRQGTSRNTYQLFSNKVQERTSYVTKVILTYCRFIIIDNDLLND